MEAVGADRRLVLFQRSQLGKLSHPFLPPPYAVRRDERHESPFRVLLRSFAVKLFFNTAHWLLTLLSYFDLAVIRLRRSFWRALLRQRRLRRDATLQGLL